VKQEEWRVDVWVIHESFASRAGKKLKVEEKTQPLQEGQPGIESIRNTKEEETSDRVLSIGKGSERVKSCRRA